MSRLFDVNGGVIIHPKGFDDAVKAIIGMIDGMEQDGIDRSDMRAMLNVLLGEAVFHLLFLKNREVTP